MDKEEREMKRVVEKSAHIGPTVAAEKAAYCVCVALKGNTEYTCFQVVPTLQNYAKSCTSHLIIFLTTEKGVRANLSMSGRGNHVGTMN